VRCELSWKLENGDPGIGESANGEWRMGNVLTIPYFIVGDYYFFCHFTSG